MTSSMERDAAARRLAELIDRCRADIERRWLERVEAELALNPGLEATKLRDGLPDYLIALVHLLSTGDEGRKRNDEPTWARTAREHGITRVRIGFNINQLIREFVVLRHVIRDIAEERGTSIGGPDSLLTDCLDGAIAESVSAYVDARDYQARQKEAENIGFITHELRNPLSTAMMAASRLREHAPPGQDRVLDVLDRSLRRLSELIDSVLLTERFEAGEVECKPATVTLGDVLEPALEAARATAHQKGLDFRVKYNPELVVRIDPFLTRSAIQNLVDNAAKYTDHGGIEVTVDELSQSFVVHVRDSCEGISVEELRIIFEPFKRGPKNVAGAGLGLAIARRAVEAQRGSLEAESSEESNGCHFWITLPKWSDAEPELA